MKVSQLSAVITALYNSGRTGMLWGQPGIGKSFAFRTAAEAIKNQLGLTGPVLERHEIKPFLANGGDISTAFGLFDLRLSQTDPVEVGGLPRENKQHGTMEKLPPSWFAHTLREDLPDFGILLLEELPSAPLSVQTAAYQITLDKVIDDFKLKEGWACFAAGNRLTDGGQYFKMPNALANRLCHIDVESNLDSWVEFAIDNGIDHSLIAFLRLRPDLLNTYEEHIGKGGKGKGEGFAFATERAWHAVDDFLKQNPNAGTDLMMAVIGGTVGKGPAAEYIGFRKVWQNMPSIDQILIDPDSAILPEDAATQFAVMTALAGRASYDNLGQCFKYTERLMAQGRAEMAVLFIKDMQRRDSLRAAQAQKEGQQYTRTVASPQYAVWASKNKDLFS